jgi:hypothetical protein
MPSLRWTTSRERELIALRTNHDITRYGGFMRYKMLIATMCVVAIAACSADSLDPAPSTDVQTVGAHHGSDTAITSNPQTPPQLPPVVASFNLSGTVLFMELGTDTTRQSPLPNAGVTVVKMMTVEGDTLMPSVTIGSTTTDAQGAYRFENLAPAYYRIDFDAPAGSPFVDRSMGIGPARETEIKLSVALERKR